MLLVHMVRTGHHGFTCWVHLQQPHMSLMSVYTAVGGGGSELALFAENFCFIRFREHGRYLMHQVPHKNRNFRKKIRKMPGTG